MKINTLTPLANQIISIAASIAATGQLISRCSLSEKRKESLMLNISERLKLIQMLTDARPEERIKTLQQVEDEIRKLIMQAFTDRNDAELFSEMKIQKVLKAKSDSEDKTLNRLNVLNNKTTEECIGK